MPKQWVDSSVKYEDRNIVRNPHHYKSPSFLSHRLSEPSLFDADTIFKDKLSVKLMMRVLGADSVSELDSFSTITDDQLSFSKEERRWSLRKLILVLKLLWSINR